MGFDGKTIIHPKQIETANRVFTPSPEEVARCQKIIEVPTRQHPTLVYSLPVGAPGPTPLIPFPDLPQAHREAEDSGQGVVVVDGSLIENLHVRQAERLLKAFGPE